MPGAIYQVGTEGSVALVAATAKTVLAVVAPAQFGLSLKAFKLGFDGVAASALPVLVEVIRFTTDGTGTTATPTQAAGKTIVHGTTAKRNYTAEPTAITVIEGDLWVDPNKLFASFEFPLGDEPDCAVSEGIGLRLNAPAAVNVRAQLRWVRL